MGTMTEGHWQRKAIGRATAAMQKIGAAGTVMPKGTPVDRLGETEWGWLFSAGLFAWLSVRSEQATAEGKNVEALIQQHPAWDFGCISTVLPQVADIQGVDWSKPLGDWSKDLIVLFLGRACDLITAARAARDRGNGVTRRQAPDRIGREANAAAGGPLVVGDELNDLVPF